MKATGSPRWYILKDKTPVPISNVVEWAMWFQLADADGSRVVGNWTFGDTHISTVFLGIDHQFGGGPPMLFETMIFGGTQAGYQARYSTWDEAQEGHMEICQQLARRKATP